MDIHNYKSVELWLLSGWLLGFRFMRQGLAM